MSTLREYVDSWTDEDYQAQAEQVARRLAFERLHLARLSAAVAWLREAAARDAAEGTQASLTHLLRAAARLSNVAQAPFAERVARAAP